MVEGPIIVTGCQRSGTTLAAHIFGDLCKYVVWEDSDWLPSQPNIDILKHFINTDRTRLVIQSPTVLHNFPYIFHSLPQLHFIGLKRKTKDIVASMKRVQWMQDEVYHYPDFYHDHIQFMNSQWGLLKQLLPQSSWTEVNFNELKQYPQFIPKDQRSNFTTKQWQLNKPSGPQYWRSQTPKTGNESSSMQIKTKSSKDS